jgi:hypothetical protein
VDGRDEPGHDGALYEQSVATICLAVPDTRMLAPPSAVISAPSRDGTPMSSIEPIPFTFHDPCIARAGCIKRW